MRTFIALRSSDSAALAALIPGALRITSPDSAMATLQRFREATEPTVLIVSGSFAQQGFTLPDDTVILTDTRFPENMQVQIAARNRRSFRPRGPTLRGAERLPTTQVDRMVELPQGFRNADGTPMSPEDVEVFMRDLHEAFASNGEPGIVDLKEVRPAGHPLTNPAVRRSAADLTFEELSAAGRAAALKAIDENAERHITNPAAEVVPPVLYADRNLIQPVASAAVTTREHQGYWMSNAIALDMFANTLLNGRVSDTISARVGRSIWHGGWAYRIRRVWPRWWVDHCYWAAGLPPRSYHPAVEAARAAGRKP